MAEISIFLNERVISTYFNDAYSLLVARSQNLFTSSIGMA